MSELILDRTRYVRITSNLTARVAEKNFVCPFGNAAEGEIMPVTERPCDFIIAQPLDTFSSIARKTGRDEQKLMQFNGGAIYPLRKIYLY